MAYRPSLLQELARWLYSFMLLLLLPILYRVMEKKNKGVKDCHQAKLSERFGAVPATQDKHGVLFHCVSVGEVMAAATVIHKLINDKPTLSITVTTTTATGSARVKSLFGDRVNHFYLPFDLPFAMNAMLKHVTPALLVITEVELWPNLIHCAWKKGIPSVVLNARMTDRSAKRYQSLSALFQPMLHKLTHVCAQGQRDADNYLTLGLSEQKLTLTNNLKFDLNVPDNSTSTFFNSSNPNTLTLVGGSTHEGEERALVNAADKLNARVASIRLILVPRHPNRFDEVASWLDMQQRQYVRTSQVEVLSGEENLILVDEMGRLNDVYGSGDIAFVGGSLAPRGGHNALEAAAQGLPVIMGTSIYNNPAICETLVDANAMSLVADEDALVRALESLVSNQALRQEQGQAGLDVIKANRGAVDAAMGVFEKYLN